MQKFFHIDFIRHGPKDLNTSHITGSEALLTGNADISIEEWAEEYIDIIRNFKKILIISSPVTRSIQTAEIIAEFLSENNIQITERKINPQFSSYDLKDDKIQNLNPKEMSQLWSDAKDANNTSQKEDKSLYKWSEVGFKKKWTHNSMSQ